MQLSNESGSRSIAQELRRLILFSVLPFVVLLGVLNIFFYLDKRAEVLLLSILLLVLNLAFTAMTLLAGAPFYGYGFALALLATVLTAMLILDGKLQRLEYETFMLQ